MIRMHLCGAEDRPALVPLAGGVSSLIVRAETRTGTVCIKRALPRLRVASDWFAPVERNRAEFEWLRLASGVAPDCVPAVLADDPTTLSFAMKYLHPCDFPVWKEQLRDGCIEARIASAVGLRLAEIHAATAGRDDVARRFANDAAFFALRLEPYFLAAGRAHPEWAGALEALVAKTGSTRLALVHGDVSPKNILVGPRGPVFLDAECAWYGDPAFDLAFCLNHLSLKCVWRRAWTSRYLECFSALAAAYLGRVDWESPRAIEARTAALLPGLVLARMDGKSPVEYVADTADRDALRRFAKARLRIAPDCLGDWCEDWRRQWS